VEGGATGGGSPLVTMDLRRGGREFPDPFAFREETAFREEARN
jgi:hypothetical protein